MRLFNSKKMSYIPRKIQSYAEHIKEVHHKWSLQALLELEESFSFGSQSWKTDRVYQLIIRESDYATAHLAAKKHIDLTKLYCGKSLVSLAALYNKRLTLAVLKKKGAVLDGSDGSDQTPLCCAIEHENWDVVSDLLSYDPSRIDIGLHKVTPLGETALILAVKACQPWLVKALISMGALLDPSPGDIKTLLIEAAKLFRIRHDMEKSWIIYTHILSQDSIRDEALYGVNCTFLFHPLAGYHSMSNSMVKTLLDKGSAGITAKQMHAFKKNPPFPNDWHFMQDPRNPSKYIYENCRFMRQRRPQLWMCMSLLDCLRPHPLHPMTVDEIIERMVDIELGYREASITGIVARARMGKLYAAVDSQSKRLAKDDEKAPDFEATLEAVKTKLGTLKKEAETPATRDRAQATAICFGRIGSTVKFFREANGNQLGSMTDATETVASVIRFLGGKDENPCPRQPEPMAGAGASAGGPGGA